ncbi:hypothetical protein [Erwinia piriflorinigrans]|uniref:Uncharacterized protein n=1 Tax=Erwinia piriflorinigrans CFBP 5888 TaxID=1161919 RepID=V5ZCA2_9GAMM|nr:hypothetical protein [Erwinia piriflorinigrans]CCG88905.1 hypothetical protein EPIR_3542 [Erwinia piriflorinigrans CFBP 5888]
MSITKLDLLVLNVYNKIGLTISGYEARKILKKIESVENTPAGMKIMHNNALRDALRSKAIRTNDNILKENILGVLCKNNNLSHGSAESIRVMTYTENKEPPIMMTNAKESVFLKGNTLSDNESKCQSIAQKLFAINKNSLMGIRIKMELEDRGIPLKSSSKSNFDLIAMREKNVSKISKTIDEINEFQKRCNKVPGDDELVPAGQEKYLQIKTKESCEAILKIDKILAERRARTDIIMAKAENYLVHMPLVLDGKSKDLIIEYNNSKKSQANTPD